MATTNTPIFAQQIINPCVQILPADLSNFKTLRTGSTNGDRIDNLIAVNSDTTARVLQFAINNGATDFIIGEVSLPALAGADGVGTVKGVNVLSPANFPGLNANGSLYLQAGYLLKVKSLTTIGAGKQVNLVGFGGAY